MGSFENKDVLYHLQCGLQSVINVQTKDLLPVKTKRKFLDGCEQQRELMF